MAYELAPWRPFRGLAPSRDFERMRREMARLWDYFFERVTAREEVESLPDLDVSETKDEILVKPDVPCMETYE